MGSRHEAKTRTLHARVRLRVPVAVRRLPLLYLGLPTSCSPHGHVAASSGICFGHMAAAAVICSVQHAGDGQPAAAPQWQPQYACCCCRTLSCWPMQPPFTSRTTACTCTSEARQQLVFSLLAWHLPGVSQGGACSCCRDDLLQAVKRLVANNTKEMQVDKQLPLVPCLLAAAPPLLIMCPNPLYRLKPSQLRMATTQQI
jgi:hypothetical protein